MRRYKKVYFISLFILINCSFLHSQSVFILDNSWNNYAFNNAAAAGLTHKYYFSSVGSKQFENIAGSPQSLNVNFDTYFNKLKSGIGVNYLYDEIGSFTTNTIYLNYNYQKQFTDNQKISFGVKLGVQNLEIGNMYMVMSDNSIQKTSSSSVSNSTLGFGVAYKSEKQTIGFSSNNIVNRSITKSSLHFSDFPTFNLYYQYHFKFSTLYEFKPTAFLSYSDPTPFFLNINLLNYINKTFWVGLNFNSNFDYGSSVGIDIKQKLRIGYSFLTNSNTNLSNQHYLNHYIVLAFMLD